MILTTLEATDRISLWHYKDLKKPGTTDVQGWGDVEAAKRSLLNLSNDTKNKHEHD